MSVGLRLTEINRGYDHESEVGERDQEEDCVSHELRLEEARRARAVDDVFGVKLDDTTPPGNGGDCAINLDPACGEFGGRIP